MSFATATSGVPLQYDHLHDLSGVMMVDKQRDRMFTSIGTMREAFRGCTSWPPLSQLGPPDNLDRNHDGDDEQHERVGRLLTMEGGDRTLAVRFLPEEVRDDRFTMIGIDVADVDPESDAATERPPRRSRNAGGSPRVRPFKLNERAEQCLWAVHHQLLRQRCSFVQLPDVWLGRFVWGPVIADWPANWRRDLFDVLWSLERLKIVQVFGNVRVGFQIGEVSSLVAGVSDSRFVRAGEECDEHCPLRTSDVKHHHFCVQVGMGFLGVLEGFKVQDGPRRHFDFNPAPSDVSDQIRNARATGAIIPVSPLLKICGPVRNGPFSRSQRHLLSGLLREVTRVPKTDRSDKAKVLSGNRVVGTRAKSELLCSQLPVDGRFVTFGGNGKRPGMGYRIIGKNDRGWLHKCGYKTPQADAKMSKEVRRFLKDLEVLSKTLGFIVVGLLPVSEQWLSLETMVSLARGNGGWFNVDEVHLRVYAPENYQDLLRDAHLTMSKNVAKQRRGGLTERSAPRRKELKLLATEQLLALAAISTRELASQLRISEAFVSQVRTGKKPWPPIREEMVRRFAIDRLLNA